MLKKTNKQLPLLGLFILILLSGIVLFYRFNRYSDYKYEDKIYLKFIEINHKDSTLNNLDQSKLEDRIAEQQIKNANIVIHYDGEDCGFIVKGNKCDCSIGPDDLHFRGKIKYCSQEELSTCLKNIFEFKEFAVVTFPKACCFPLEKRKTEADRIIKMLGELDYKRVSIQIVSTFQRSIIFKDVKIEKGKK